MSIKQTEVPEEDLLLLLPAAGKWLSGDTYKLGRIVPYAEFKKSFGRLLKRVTLPDTKLSMNQSGTATVRRKVGLDLDTLAVNLTGEGLLLGEFTVSRTDTEDFRKDFGKRKTSHGRAEFKWALHDCVEEMEVNLPIAKQSYRHANNIEGATSTEIYWGYEVLVHTLVATALWVYEGYA